MASVLNVDDIEVGQFVAFHSPVPSSNAVVEKIPGSQASKFAKGLPLQVRGISLPFVACELVVLKHRNANCVIVDVRQSRLCKLNQEFVDAVVSASSKGTTSSCECCGLPF